MKNKVCFCGISEHCGYQIETDMEQHDKVIYEQGYNKAIDEFVDKAYFVLGSEDSDIYCKETINEIAQQLKEGVKNESDC